MTFARRLTISSIMSVTILAIVTTLLVWTSQELTGAGENDSLADEIQTVIFYRASLRDEYFLQGMERARQQWFALNGDAERLLGQGVSRFTESREKQVLEQVLSDFKESVAISQRLVRQLQGAHLENSALAHHNEYAGRLYSQITLKDSALQKGTSTLQKAARDRFNRANQRVIALSFLLVLLMVMVTIVNATFINGLLRRRLEQLRAGAGKIASGDFGFRLLCQGSDELADLSGVFNSVTEKVQDYTRRLQKSHNLLNDLSSQVPGILFQAHLAPDGTFTTPYLSRGLQDVYPDRGEQAALETSCFFARFHPKEFPSILTSFLRSAALAKPWDYECRVAVADGAVRWLRGQARPMRLKDGGTLWHGFIYDLTERKLMEEALHQSERRFRLQLQELANIYTLTPVGLFAVDHELRFLRLNERLAEFNCRPISEHLGRTLDEVLPAELVAELKAIYRPVLERGECVLNVEVKGQEDWPTGLRYWLLNCHPLVSEAGKVIGLLGSVLDITERKRAEQLMAGARLHLEQKVQQRTAKLLLTNEHLLQEIEVRKKVEFELLAQQQKLQEMALDFAMAEERERDRIASELHDQVGQRLILAKMKIDSLASILASGACEAEAASVESLIEQTIQDIRSLTFQLRPPILASAGLEAALRWLGEELRADFGLEVTFSDDGTEKPLRYEIRSTLFQAVRELMLNVAKHAGTSKCHVGLRRDGGFIVILVDDDGVGLKLGQAGGSRIRSGGFGLLNVRQKIHHLGGTFDIEAKETVGTRATISVPLDLADYTGGNL